MSNSLCCFSFTASFLSNSFPLKLNNRHDHHLNSKCYLLESLPLHFQPVIVVILSQTSGWISHVRMFGWFLTDTTLREQFEADGEHDMIDKEGKKDCLPETKTRMGTDAVTYLTFVDILRRPYEVKLQFSRGRDTRKY